MSVRSEIAEGVDERELLRSKEVSLICLGVNVALILMNMNWI